MDGHLVEGALPVATKMDPAERLAALFDAHHARLYRLARRLVPTTDDALDLVQETFVRAARSAQRVPEGKSNEEAWLVRVLLNIRRDQWRKIQFRNSQDSAARDHFATTQPSTNPEVALIAKATVWQALDQLAPRRRAVIVMHELEAMSVPAIAALLGISAITVRWHLSAGRRELARALTTYRGDSK